MSGAIIGFIIWAIFGCMIICIGISSLFSKKAVGFWANIKPINAKDIKGYNRATGMLWNYFCCIRNAITKWSK